MNTSPTVHAVRTLPGEYGSADTIAAVDPSRVLFAVNAVEQHCAMIDRDIPDRRVGRLR